MTAAATAAVVVTVAVAVSGSSSSHTGPDPVEVTPAGSGVRVPERASGRYTVAAGVSPSVGSGRPVTYSVEVEEGLPFDLTGFAATVDDVLADPRGWTAVQATAVRRVPLLPRFRIRLASPRTADALCAPLRTGGRLSCHNGPMVVLNAWRWAHGADAYRDDLAHYRVYMVNHEFGHALGHGHVGCPEPGRPAPVMLQQTLRLDGCRANPWPASE